MKPNISGMNIPVFELAPSPVMPLAHCLDLAVT
jgi:hypothetical protein